jgi:hypothetical protein
VIFSVSKDEKHKIDMDQGFEFELSIPVAENMKNEKTSYTTDL